MKIILPYWQQEWRGEGFKPVWGFFLTINLALLALGIATAWERLKWVGLVPLASYLAYFASNALAMTSGGRYIVPVDWVILLYYLLGALAVCAWAIERLGWERFSSIDGSLEPALNEWPVMGGRWLQVITNLLFIFAAGSLVVLPEYIFPLRYASAPDSTQAVGWMKEQGIFDHAGSTLADAGLDEGTVQHFLSQQGAGVWIGRALYPRHYETDHGETTGDFPFNTQPYPRMAFILIGPDEQLGVILPGGVRRQFENAADVLVLGCYSENRQGFAGGRIDAVAVFLTEEPGLVFVRSPLPLLECPLPGPVCIDGATCK